MRIVNGLGFFSDIAYRDHNNIVFSIETFAEVLFVCKQHCVIFLVIFHKYKSDKKIVGERFN